MGFSIRPRNQAKVGVAPLELTVLQDVEVRGEDNVHCLFESVGWASERIRTSETNQQCHFLQRNPCAPAQSHQTETAGVCRSLEAPLQQRSTPHCFHCDYLPVPVRGCNLATVIVQPDLSPADFFLFAKLNRVMKVTVPAQIIPLSPFKIYSRHPTGCHGVSERDLHGAFAA